MKKLEVIFLKWKTALVVFLLKNLSRLFIEFGIKSPNFPMLTKALDGPSPTCFFSMILCPVPATLALKFFQHNQAMPWTGSSHTLCSWSAKFLLTFPSSPGSFLWFLLENYFSQTFLLTFPLCLASHMAKKLSYSTCWLYFIILSSICNYIILSLLVSFLSLPLANKLHTYFGQLYIPLT